MQRIDAAAAARIVLVVAPAGYGKSLALSHWLDRRLGNYMRFDVQTEHNTLLGFARGMAEACAQFPALRQTVATAFQNSASADAPGQEMARWMATHLESYTGVIAIDDFHRAGEDVEVSRFLAALIGRTKSHVQWVVSTRSTLDLPVASWLAYGDTHFVIGDRELTFLDEEALELSGGLGQALSGQALRGIMDATSGWPVALGLALRSGSVLSGGTDLSHSTREVLFQYLAEQVYSDLSTEERDVLHFAAYLPSIDVAVLEVAGYHTSSRVLEAVRRRATFLSLESPGKYACHDLFREFLRGQLERTNPAAGRRMQEKAADALERSGDTVAALRLYAQVRATDRILRILRSQGFDLMDHSHGDVVESALQAVPRDVRSSDAIILGLRAQRAADSGHFERAEALFKSALATDIEADAAAVLALRFAIMLLNEGRAVAHLLESAMDGTAKGLRAEILGLLAIDYSSRGLVENAKQAIAEAEELCALLDDRAVVAKVNLRTAVAGMNIGRPSAEVWRAANRAAELAEQAELLMLAGRASTVLATISLCLDNDLKMHIHYAEIARIRAACSGDRENFESALVQLASASAQLGDIERLRQFLNELSEAGTTPPWHEGIIECLRASLFIWNGDFERAERQMAMFRSRGYSYYAFDKVVDIALHAMLCIATGDAARGLSILREGRVVHKNIQVPHAYAQSQCDIALALTAMARTMAHRSLGRNHCRTVTVKVETRAAKALLQALQALSSGEHFDRRAISAKLQILQQYNLAGLAKTVSSCIGAWQESLPHDGRGAGMLTPSELSVMQLVQRGFSTKEIALQKERSVHTVRTQIQRAIVKLGCATRYEAVEVLRRGIGT